MDLTGIIVKLGSEGVKLRSESKNKMLFRKFELWGSSLAKNGKLDELIMNNLEKPYLFPKFGLFVIGILKQTGLIDHYWNLKLKENKAFSKRFDAPYIEN
jgi:hypothetical protein